MYAKATNGIVEQYPYTLGNLRRDNPNTSFPKKPSTEMLAEWGMYPVTLEEEPEYNNETHNISVSDSPVLVNGNWVLQYSVTEKTQEEKDAILSGKEEHARFDRDARLMETDWWALPDSPTITAEQTAYRQALRDITSHANWPNLDEADWPTKP